MVGGLRKVGIGVEAEDRGFDFLNFVRGKGFRIKGIRIRLGIYRGQGLRTVADGYLRENRILTAKSC